MSFLTCRLTMTMFVVVLISLLFVSPEMVQSQEKGKEIERVEDAVEVFKNLVDIPEEGIPEALLSRAEAIAVIPGFWKAAWVIGGSVGFQIGVQRADVILVFKNKRSVRNIAEGTFTLGAEAGLAAGPVGRKGEASTDIAFEAEIYSYSESKGLFAGISIEGASLYMDDDANALFYRDFNLTADDILTRDKIKAPSIAEVLRKTIAEFTR